MTPKIHTCEVLINEKPAEFPVSGSMSACEFKMVAFNYKSRDKAWEFEGAVLQALTKAQRDFNLTDQDSDQLKEKEAQAEASAGKSLVAIAKMTGSYTKLANLFESLLPKICTIESDGKSTAYHKGITEHAFDELGFDVVAFLMAEYCENFISIQ